MFFLFFYLLNKIYADLYKIESATYHNNLNLLCSLVWLYFSVNVFP